MDKKQLDFAFLAYQTSIKTYNEISNRVSTRFNIILTIDIALAGFFADTWFKNEIRSDNGSFILPIMGLLISTILYFQSAQDKYILKKQIERVNKIRDQILLSVNLPDFPSLFSPLDLTDSIDDVKPQRDFEFVNLFCWRSNLFSITKIPGWISGILLVFWIVILTLNWNMLFR